MNNKKTINPKDADAWYNRGLVEDYLGIFMAALADLNTALPLTPKGTSDYNDTIDNRNNILHFLHMSQE